MHLYFYSSKIKIFFNLKSLLPLLGKSEWTGINHALKQVKYFVSCKI